MPRIAVLVTALLSAAVLFAALPATAQPRQLGTYGAWIAATTQEAGQAVCYAFTRAARSEGTAAGRAAPTLTVTHRPGGRDQVAVSAGYTLPRGAEVALTVGDSESKSYATVQSSAFFGGGDRLVGTFRSGREAVARSPAPSGGRAVTDTFSLGGFTAAYEAISRACPVRPAR